MEIAKISRWYWDLKSAYFSKQRWKDHYLSSTCHLARKFDSCDPKTRREKGTQSMSSPDKIAVNPCPLMINDEPIIGRLSVN
jgi:hypothetical protein